MLLSLSGELYLKFSPGDVVTATLLRKKNTARIFELCQISLNKIFTCQEMDEKNLNCLNFLDTLHSMTDKILRKSEKSIRISFLENVFFVERALTIPGVLLRYAFIGSLFSIRKTAIDVFVIYETFKIQISIRSSHSIRSFSAIVLIA